MKLPLLLAAFSLFTLPVIAANEAESKKDKLPKSLTVNKLKNGNVEYVISGIYKGGGYRTGGEKDSYETDYTSRFEACIKQSYDWKKSKVIVTTDRELTREELMKSVDRLAWFGGDIPYWSELVARDYVGKKKSGILYEKVKLKKEVPENLAWFWFSSKAWKDKKGGSQPLGVPINLEWGNKLGKIIVNQKTALCMCHNYHSIRILDSQGQTVFEDTSFRGGLSYALADSNNDGVHELYIRTSDHGNEEAYVIQPKKN